MSVELHFLILKVWSNMIWYNQDRNFTDVMIVGLQLPNLAIWRNITWFTQGKKKSQMCDYEAAFT